MQGEKWQRNRKLLQTQLLLMFGCNDGEMHATANKTWPAAN